MANTPGQLNVGQQPNFDPQPSFVHDLQIEAAEAPLVLRKLSVARGNAIIQLLEQLKNDILQMQRDIQQVHMAIQQLSNEVYARYINLMSELVGNSSNLF